MTSLDQTSSEEAVLLTRGYRFLKKLGEGAYAKVNQPFNKITNWKFENDTVLDLREGGKNLKFSSSPPPVGNIIFHLINLNSPNISSRNVSSTGVKIRVLFDGRCTWLSTSPNQIRKETALWRAR